jgi:hypothetical protein
MARIDDAGIDRLVEIIRTEQGPQDAKDKRIAEQRHALRRLGFDVLVTPHSYGRVRGIVLG